jgi:ribosomal protein L37AE/L43A
MTQDSSGKGTGLFGKKGISSKDVKLCIINKFDREEFFRKLREFGWEELESAFTFDFNWTEKKIRKAATDHAAEVMGDLLIEIRDRDYARNPFNDYVYYVWRSGPNTRGLPPPPSMAQQQAFGQQALQQQQLALMQQQQMLQRMQMQMQTASQQMPPQPGQVPTGQACSRCGNTQIQFMANGMGKCIKCGFMFRWQGQAQVPAPAQSPPPAQTPAPAPTQAPVQAPAPTQAPQPQVQPQAQPQVQQPQSVGPTPTPPGTRACPKCGTPLNVFPDGSFLCNKCGHTGK